MLSGQAISFFLLTICFIIFSLNRETNADLIAYLHFDDNTAEIYTGTCSASSGDVDGVYLTADITGTNSYVPGVSGRALKLESGSYASLGDFSVYQNGAPQMSAVGWFNFESTSTGGIGNTLNYYLIGSYSTTAPNAGSSGTDDSVNWLISGYLENDAFNDFTVQLKYSEGGGGDDRIIVRNIPLLPQLVAGVWFHFGLVCDGSFLKLYVNGSLLSSDSLTKSIFEDLNGRQVFIGSNPGDATTQPYGVTVDDIRLYNHALTDAEMERLATPSQISVNRPPTIQFPGNNDNITVQITSAINEPQRSISPAITDPEGSTTNEMWVQTSSGSCSVVSLASEPDDRVAVFAFRDLAEDLTYEISSYDGELCSSSTLIINVIGVPPAGVAELPEPEQMYLTEDFEYSLEATNFSGFPLPVFNWQEFKTVNTTKNGVDYNVTETFVSIGQFRDTLVLNNLTANDTDRVFRVILTNIYGSTTSNNVTLKVADQLRPVPSSSVGDGGNDGANDGDEDSDQALPIILGVVLGSVLLCCIILIIIAIIIIIIVLRRSKSALNTRVKIYDPDYEEIAFGNMREKQKTSSSQQANYQKLEELLMGENGFQIAQVLCDTARATEADLVAKGLIMVFAAHGKGVELINFFVTKEVETSDKQGTLFRSNSIATKMFNTYARMTAINYVFKTLALPVAQLNKMAQEGSTEDEASNDTTGTLMGPVMVEVDPSKMDEAEDDQVNTLQLWLIAQKLFVSLTKASSQVPSDIRQIMSHVYNEVTAKFTEHEGFKSIGAFFFLRFVCPSLMAPQLYGLLREPPHAVAQRQLVLLAKVMQNLANDTLPGKKEGYMAKLNEFISSNQATLRKFYAAIIEQPDDGPSVNLDFPPNVTTNALSSLTDHISTFSNKIMPAMQSENAEAAEELQDIIDKEN